MSVNNDYINGTAYFIVPHYSTDSETSNKHLDEALNSIFNQTDNNWKIVIIDNFSPSKAAISHLINIEKQYPEKVKLILKNKDDGPGVSRNIGIEWAYKNDSPIILFNDADDISNPKRLETVRQIFANDPSIGVVYSTFNVIDENGKSVSKEKLAGSIAEILETHTNPLQGENVWIEIATNTGYINLTSSTAVRTEIAYKNPFPAENVSEDGHTWMRYSASGARFYYSPDIPSLYRIPQNTEGSSSRTREGGRHEFHKKMIRVGTAGFKEAVKIAKENGSFDDSIEQDLMIKFYVRLVVTLLREKEDELAAKQLMNATELSIEKTRKYCIENKEYNLQLENLLSSILI